MKQSFPFVCAVALAALTAPALAEVILDLRVDASARGYNEKNPVGPIDAAKFSVPGPGTLRITYVAQPYRPDTAAGRAGGWAIWEFPGCYNRYCIPGREGAGGSHPKTPLGGKHVEVWVTTVDQAFPNRNAQLIPNHEWVGFDAREGSQLESHKRFVIEYFPRGVTPPPATIDLASGPGAGRPPSATCPQASGPALQVCPVRVAAGGSATVEVHLVQAPDVANLNLDLRYDASVAVVEGKPQKGALLGSGTLFESNASRAGTVRLGLAARTGISGSGVLARIAFRAVGRPGQGTALTLVVTALNSSTGGSPQVATRPGRFDIEGRAGLDAGGGLPGGGSGSGGGTVGGPGSDGPSGAGEKPLTALDALSALKMSVGLQPSESRLDLDKNGQVTSNDARLILGRVVGK